MSSIPHEIREKVVRIVTVSFNNKEQKDKLASLITPASGNSNNSDNPVVKAINEAVRKNTETQNEQIGEVAIHLLQASEDKRNEAIKEARSLRRRAKELIEQATEQYNYEQHMLNEGDIAPLAYSLNILSSAQDVEVRTSLVKSPVKNYWQTGKKAQGASE